MERPNRTSEANPSGGINGGGSSIQKPYKKPHLGLILMTSSRWRKVSFKLKGFSNKKLWISTFIGEDIV